MRRRDTPPACGHEGLPAQAGTQKFESRALQAPIAAVPRPFDWSMTARGGAILVSVDTSALRAPRGFLSTTPESPRRLLPARPVGGSAVVRLRVRAQRQGQSRGAEDRQRLRLSRQHRRLRRQPIADSLYRVRTPTAASSWSACSTRCWSPASASCSRPSSASSSASRGCRPTGWWRGSPAAMSSLIRNLPLLFQILFWYLAVLGTLPGPRQSLSLFGEVFINNRGIIVPAPAARRGRRRRSLAAFAARRRSRRSRCGFWAKRRQERTGRAVPAAVDRARR